MPPRPPPQPRRPPLLAPPPPARRPRRAGLSSRLTKPWGRPVCPCHLLLLLRLPLHHHDHHRLLLLLLLPRRPPHPRCQHSCARGATTARPQTAGGGAAVKAAAPGAPSLRWYLDMPTRSRATWRGRCPASGAAGLPTALAASSGAAEGAAAARSEAARSDLRLARSEAPTQIPWRRRCCCCCRCAAVAAEAVAEGGSGRGKTWRRPTPWKGCSTGARRYTRTAMRSPSCSCSCRAASALLLLLRRRQTSRRRCRGSARTQKTSPSPHGWSARLASRHAGQTCSASGWSAARPSPSTLLPRRHSRRSRRRTPDSWALFCS